jgi:uncharacterized coiled-coil protein SlyX
MSSSEQHDPSLIQRIEDLEVRYAYLERLMADLDGVVRETADELAEIKAVVKTLHERAKSEDNAIVPGSLEEEKPPHY